MGALSSRAREMFAILLGARLGGQKGGLASRNEASVSDVRRKGGEDVGGSAPAQFVDVAEEGRVGSERCQIFEHQRQVTTISQYLGREVFDLSIPVDEPRGRHGADSRNARIAVRSVADEGEVIGNEAWLDAELGAHALGVANLLAPAVHLYDAIAANALGQV